MVNMLKRSTRREIKNSFSRWFAILAIIALGVGFFCGLKVCREAFQLTGDEYLSQQNMYDYELISTLGLDKDSVYYLNGLDGVEYVSGSRSTDIIYGFNDEELVAKLLTVDYNINKPKLIAGKLPTAANEIAVDQNRFTAEDIGKTVYFAMSNDEDTLEMLKKTSGEDSDLADSKDSDLADSEDSDLAGSDDSDMPGSEDSASINKKAYEYTITGLVESPLYMNFERGSTSLGNGSVNCYLYVPVTAWDIDYYTEVYVTLDEKHGIFTDEYDDMIDENEDRFDEALDRIANARYDDIKSEALEKLADGEKELADGKADLKDAEKKLQDAIDDLEDGKKEIRDNEKKLTDSQAELDKNRKEFEKSKKELEENEKKYDELVAAYDNLRQAGDIQSGMLSGDAMKAAYGAAGGQDMQAAYSQAQFAGGQDMQAAYSQAQLANGQDMQAAYSQAQFANGENMQATSIEAQAASMKAQITAMREQLDEAWAKLSDAKIQMNKGQKEIDNSWAEIKKAKKELADGEKKIDDAKAEILDGKHDVAKAEREISDAKKEIDDIEHPDTYLLTRNENIGYVCFDNDTNIVDGMAKIFPVFFLLVAALVVMTTMTRMVDDQRTQIGVLKALGYSKRKILSKYTTYSFSAALIGGVIGFFLGSYLFPLVIWKAYGMMYAFSDLIFVFNWTTGIISVMAALLCAVGTTIWCCYKDLSEVPAQLIRPKAPAFGKRIFLERIHFIWKKMPFLHKVSARNIFRYKKRFFMMVLGISGCTALLVTGMGINDSISNVVSQQYDEIYNIDYTVTFQNELIEEDREAFAEENSEIIDDLMFAYTLSMDAHGKDVTKAANVVVIEDMDAAAAGENPAGDNPSGENQAELARTTKFINIHTPKDRLSLKDAGTRKSYILGKEKCEGQEPIPFPKKDECIINSNLAVRLGLELGDELEITDSDMNKVTCKIVGLCENFVYNYVYISESTWNEQMGHFAPNSAFVIGKEGHNPNEDGAILANGDNVSSVSITNDFKERINSMMEAMDYVVALIIGCAGALAFIVLYNLTNINITERIREIATIKVLGFYPKETAQYVFRENFILTAIAAVVGLPLGWLLNQYVMNQVVIDLLCFDIHIEPISYAISIVVTFVFSIIVNLFMRIRLAKINMAESLKSIE